jgi:hypothetical protein
MSKDLLLYKTGNGGEVLILNNDLNLVETLYQQCFLLLFGGNVEANTTGSELNSQIREDWWGNKLFFNTLKDKQFNSDTERVLTNVVLNTSGRIDIERAVKKDLESLKKIANISINVVILSESKIEINITLIQLSNLQDKTFQFIWDNASKEVVINKTI